MLDFCEPDLDPPHTKLHPCIANLSFAAALLRIGVTIIEIGNAILHALRIAGRSACARICSEARHSTHPARMIHLRRERTTSETTRLVYFVEALKALGVNKAHSLAAVREQLRRLMSGTETRGADGKTAWERFEYKVGVALPCEGRIAVNAETLQRVHDYGLKLLQVGKEVLQSRGIVVDILKGDHGTPLYRLNTDAAEPINEFRTRRRH